MLTPIKKLERRSKDGHVLWLYRCGCGNEIERIESRVLRGLSTQCRKCAQTKTAEKNKTHGKRNSDEYRIWAGMKQRCKKSSAKEQKSYALKKITVFEEWNTSFEAFYLYVGPRPTKNHSLDRIDNSKGYMPGNVRWATRSQQQQNRDNSVFVTDGKNTSHITEIAKKLGISKGAAHLRLKRGKLNGYSKVA